jgi:hypothetical protein
MTISLLRRIWQTIHADSAAPPKQRLTGFEPLEPRMVLSGFVAFYAPDYLSPPPGDFSHIDRSGAEVSRPTVEYGSFSDYNGPSRGLGPMAFESFSANFGGAAQDRFVGRPFVSWQESFNSSSAALSGPSALFEASSSVLRPYNSPLAAADTENDEPAYEENDSEPSGEMIFRVVPTTPQAANSYSVISISPLALDRILADLRPVATSGYQLTAFTPMAMASTSMRSLTDRDYTPVNAGGAVERHEDVHEYPGTHSSASDASLALVARQAISAVDRGATSSSSDAALASQSAVDANSVIVQSGDGSRANGQAGALADSSSDGEQNGLLELSVGERLKLRRKLAGTTTELDEESGSVTGRGDRFEESDSQVPYDPTRPFDVTIPDGAIRQTLISSPADDGLIEVLAADVTAMIASGAVIDPVAANRQIVMEPAVATYQAFETIVDGGSQATDIAGDAARLAAAVAMNAQPVVQAE